MINDALVNFVPIGSPLSLIAAASATIASNVYDQLGQGAGVAPGNIFGVSRSTFGSDLGLGDNRPEINIIVGTSFVFSSGSTLKIALQGAADAGTPTYQPATWTDIASQDAITAANLVAGAIPMRFPFLPTFPANLLPRFYRLLFTIGSAGACTAGTILSATVTRNRDDWAMKYAQRNFSVA